MIRKSILHSLIFLITPVALLSQTKQDSLFSLFNQQPFTQQPVDTILRIKNLNPYFNLHVDSTLRYPLIINKDLAKYYWFLKNSPVGLKINKDIFFVSYANLPITSYLDEPPIASVEQFPYQQAEKATVVLLQLIHSKGVNENIPHKVLLESKVVVNKGIEIIAGNIK